MLKRVNYKKPFWAISISSPQSLTKNEISIGKNDEDPSMLYFTGHSI
jgi:hypothetical protein